MSDIVGMSEFREYNLTRKNVTDMLHMAITDNIVDDYTAEEIRDKAIGHSERAYGKINYKMRALYADLFKERSENKKSTPKTTSDNYSTTCQKNDTYNSSYKDYLEHMVSTYDSTYSDADEYDLDKSYFEDKLYN